MLSPSREPNSANNYGLSRMTSLGLVVTWEDWSGFVAALTDKSYCLICMNGRSIMAN